MQRQNEIIFLEQRIEEIEEMLSCTEKFDKSLHLSEEHLVNELLSLRERLGELTSNNTNNTYRNIDETLKRLHMKHRESNKHEKEERFIRIERRKNKKEMSPRKMREQLRLRDE